MPPIYLSTSIATHKAELQNLRYADFYTWTMREIVFVSKTITITESEIMPIIIVPKEIIHFAAICMMRTSIRKYNAGLPFLINELFSTIQYLPSIFIKSYLMGALKRNNVVVSGNGFRAIMFSHGFGCDQNMWRFVAPAFTDAYKIILFDHVGAGGLTIRLMNLKNTVTLTATQKIS